MAQSSSVAPALPTETRDVGPRRVQRLFAARELGVLVALLTLCVGLSFASPYFLTLRNIFNVLQGMSTIGIMAVGMTMVLISGGLDLSVGSVLAVGAVVTARLMTYSGLNPWLAVAGNRDRSRDRIREWHSVTRAKIVPFIATLGTLSIARGSAFLLATRGGSVASNVPMRDPRVAFLGAGYSVPFRCQCS